MSPWLERLNLRPLERRILVLTLTVALAVVNALFIWPHRKQWRTLLDQWDKAERTLRAYQAEVNRVPEYQARLAKLEGAGSGVLPAEQALQLERTLRNQAQQSKVTINSFRPIPPSPATSTNAFFDEAAAVIAVTAGDAELVDFLFALGTGNSMIRVRDMDLHPEPSQFRLLGNITLVASYQKRPKASPSATAPKTPTQPVSDRKKS
jgi:hypothetical protein